MRKFLLAYLLGAGLSINFAYAAECEFRRVEGKVTVGDGVYTLTDSNPSVKFLTVIEAAKLSTRGDQVLSDAVRLKSNLALGVCGHFINGALTVEAGHKEDYVTYSGSVGKEILTNKDS